ncbi:MAG: TlpA disulfide reductase family protein [Bacteroidota bacterium]|nr:TlpA disulfide reductase family protein [Bacteroidota bacterium]
MKKVLFILLVFILNTELSFGQTRKLPNINVKTLNGKKFNISKLQNGQNPIVISFWATWCKPCKKELNNIAEIYEEWQDETGVKIVAISIDDSRSKSKVAPYVNSSDWEYEVYLDQNGDLKRAMGVSTVPHTFLLNKNKEIVWQHKGYVDGDENKLFKEIKKLAK